MSHYWSFFAQVVASDGFTRLTELPSALMALLTNPTYIFINFGGAMDGITLTGLSTFLPKYLQSQFALTPSTAGILMGALIVSSGGGGTFLGGWVTKRFRLTRSGVIRMYMYCQLVTVPLSFGFLMSCANQQFAGVNLPYSDVQNENVNLTSACNLACDCTSASSFAPICGDDGLTYLSSCHAG